MYTDQSEIENTDRIFLSKLYFASINYLGADEMFIVYCTK